MPNTCFQGGERFFLGVFVSPGYGPGFKPQHGIDICIFLLKQVVSCYVSRVTQCLQLSQMSLMQWSPNPGPKTNWYRVGLWCRNSDFRLTQAYYRIFMYRYLLFLILSCAYAIFRYEIIIHSFLFCVDFLLFYTLFKHFFDHIKSPWLNLIHSLAGFRSRRFLGGVGFLTTLGVEVGSFCPTPDVQLDHIFYITLLNWEFLLNCYNFF